MAQTISVNPELVAACGLYCGACRKFLKGSCPGCRENATATWCKVRACNWERSTRSCAQCREHQNPRDCKIFQNPVARLFGVLFNSDRVACIEQIRACGLDEHARRLAASGRMTIPRHKS